MGRHPIFRRGSVISLSIVLSVILTGLAVTLAWLAGTHAGMAGQIPKIDASFYAAEAGAQHAMWYYKHNNYWRATSASPFTGTINMYNTNWNYSVICSDAVSDANLIWKFDENTGTTTADNSGHGNTGTFHGGVSWFTPGRAGSCVLLNGIDGYIDCGNNSSTNIVGDITISAWVKMNSGVVDQKIASNESNLGGGYKLCIYNTKVEFEVRHSDNYASIVRDVAGGTILTMGTWYNIVGVCCENGHYLKTYVNGKLDRTLQGDGSGVGINNIDAVPVGALASTTGNLIIGREPYTNIRYFNGYIDDIRIWSRVLSDQEINAIYNTSVTLQSTVTGGQVSNTTSYTVSVPTPPPPTIPAITVNTAYTANNITVNGDVSANGNVICTNATLGGNLNANGNVTSPSGTSTITGNLNYAGSYTPNSHLTVQGTAAPTSVTVNLPTIDLTYLHNQATTYGQVVAGNSTGQTFVYNKLLGNKVIWIQGNLQDPIVTISGLDASGGTLVVDGTVKFTSASTTLGASGYPVYIVSSGDITQTGANLTLIGALYTTGNFTHKTCNITGPVCVSKTITNNATAACTFTTATIPWFDNRAVPQQATLPLFTSNHIGNGP